MDSYLFCDRFDWRNKNSEFWTLERWCNNLARWYHPHQYPEFRYIKISKFWKSSLLASQLVVSEKIAFREFCWAGGDGGMCLFVSVHRPLQILSLSLYLSISLVQLYAVWTLNNKWLLIVDGEFLFLSCQHPGNFVLMDHHDRQKKSVDLSNTKFWIQTRSTLLKRLTLFCIQLLVKGLDKYKITFL